MVNVKQMITTGDKVYGLFGVDSGDGGEWLISIWQSQEAAENAVKIYRSMRPARMTETMTDYRVMPLVVQG